MKKKIAAHLAVLLLLVAVVGVGVWWFAHTRIVIDGEVYLRELTEADFSGGSVEEFEKLTELTALETLDLRDTGLTVQEYEYLSQALPDCRILWSVPFQNGYYSEETTELTVISLRAEDLERLAYLPNLTTVHAEACRDYEILMELKEVRPELDVFYNVSVGGSEYRENTTEITLENGDIQELAWALPYLPQLKTVTFTGNAPENEQIYELMVRYPDVMFAWDFELFGVSVNSLDTELILSNIQMESVDGVEESLKYFYDLQWVEMCECGIPSEEMDALWKRHPETRFVWTVHVGNCVLRTDVTALIPYKFGHSMYNKLYDDDCVELKYCVDMVCLDMGHMGITDYSFLEYMPRLQYLILADTPGTDFSPIANCTEMVFLELFLTNFSDTELLAGMTRLEDLNLSFTMVRDVEHLVKMTWLKRLWLPGTFMSAEEQRALREAIPDAKILFRANASTTDGWRQSPNYYKMRDLLGMEYLT